MTEQPKDGGAAFDLAQMIADREAGTPADKWVPMPTPARNPDWVNADLRRVNRVHTMEAEIIRLTARVAELEGAISYIADGFGLNAPAFATPIFEEEDDDSLEDSEWIFEVIRAALSTHTEEPKT